MDRLCKALLVSLFLVAIFIPATGWLAGWRIDAQIEEKRASAPWPTLTDLKLNAAGAAKSFEDAFADRFAFRNVMIKTDAWLNWKLFGISTTENVVVGRDGWLFYTGDRSMPLFQGVDRYTHADAAYVADVLEMRHHWLRDQGIASAHVIAPAKESVYPEFVPRGIPRVRQPSCMEEFLAFGQGREGQPIDLLHPLTSARAAGPPLYLRGDSHWNDAGALIAYREVLRKLGHEAEGLAEAALQSHVDPATHPYHDLATMLGIGDTYMHEWPNDSPVIQPKAGWTFEQTSDPSQPMRRTKNTAPLLGQRVLMFGDSFSEALLPFMAQTFASVTLYQGRFFSPAKILEHSPQIVVLESAERLFFHNRPASAEEASVIHSPAWAKRITDAGTRARVLFDSAESWAGAVFRPRRSSVRAGPISVPGVRDKAGVNVPLNLGTTGAEAAVAVRVQIQLAHAGLLKWQFENKRGDVVAPSWLIHVELHAGVNDVCFGLPARSTASIDRLNVALQTEARGAVSIQSLRVVELPRLQ